MGLTNAVEVIKDSVSAVDVARAVGLSVDSHGRCRCPFHNGKDRNLKLFPGNRGYNCFVCHESGDVISFVQKYHSLSFKDSVAWINATFRLGLDLDRQIDPREQRQAETARKLRKNAIEHEEWKERMQFEMALTADKLLARLEDIRDRNAPKTPGERWSDIFCEAVRRIPEARDFAKDCFAECIKEKDE